MCGNMLLMDSQKSWLLIGRAKLSSTNGPLFIPFCFCEHMLNCMLLSSRGCPMISPLYWNCILCVPIWILVSLYCSSLRPLSCIYPIWTHFPEVSVLFCGIQVFFPHISTLFLSNFVATNVYVLFCEFGSFFPHISSLLLLNFVATDVYALSLKILKSLPAVFFPYLVWLFSLPCLSKILKSTPATHAVLKT